MRITFEIILIVTNMALVSGFGILAWAFWRTEHTFMALAILFLGMGVTYALGILADFMLIVEVAPYWWKYPYRPLLSRFPIAVLLWYVIVVFFHGSEKKLK